MEKLGVFLTSLTLAPISCADSKRQVMAGAD